MTSTIQTASEPYPPPTRKTMALTLRDHPSSVAPRFDDAPDRLLALASVAGVLVIVACLMLVLAL